MAVPGTSSRTSTTTLAPTSTSSAVTCEPRKPVAPVTATGRSFQNEGSGAQVGSVTEHLLRGRCRAWYEPAPSRGGGVVVGGADLVEHHAEDAGLVADEAGLGPVGDLGRGAPGLHDQEGAGGEAPDRERVGGGEDRRGIDQHDVGGVGQLVQQGAGGGPAEQLGRVGGRGAGRQEGEVGRARVGLGHGEELEALGQGPTALEDVGAARGARRAEQPVGARASAGRGPPGPRGCRPGPASGRGRPWSRWCPRRAARW